MLRKMAPLVSTPQAEETPFKGGTFSIASEADLCKGFRGPLFLGHFLDNQWVPPKTLG
jgi:hypothetical protein